MRLVRAAMAASTTSPAGIGKSSVWCSPIPKKSTPTWSARTPCATTFRIVWACESGRSSSSLVTSPKVSRPKTSGNPPGTPSPAEAPTASVGAAVTSVLSVLGLLDRFDLELEARLLAHQDAAGLDGHVPGEPEVLAIDLGAGREAGPPVAHRIGCPAVVLDLEADSARDAVDRQITVYEEVSGRFPFDPRALERDLRIALDVEEVGRTQVLVALLVPALDAGGIDVDLHPR